VRTAGLLGAVGGLLAILASLPSRWYGAVPGDSYVFDPPVFSPLWVERTIVPVLTVVAGALVVLGIVGLLRRDWAVAGRLRRWSGVAAVLGLVVFELGVVAFTVVSGATAAGIDDLTAIGGTLVGLAGLGLGAVLGLPALVALGVGYGRTDRPLVGYMLAGSPLVAAGLAAGGPAGFGTLPVAVPMGLALVVVGWELWTHPEPVGEAGDETDETAGESETAAVGDAEDSEAAAAEHADASTDRTREH
jgi:hypothetical protein